MAQGSGKLRKSGGGRGGNIKRNRIAKSRNKSRQAKIKKKSKLTKLNPGMVRHVKSGKKVHGAKTQRRITGVIKNNIEEIMAGRVIQAGGTFKHRDLKGKGKMKVRELQNSIRQKEIAKKRRYQQIKKLEEEIKNMDGSDDENELDL